MSATMDSKARPVTTDVPGSVAKMGGTATNTPRQKVLASTAAAGLAAPLMVIILYLLKQNGLDFPEPVQAAISAVVTIAVTLAVGWSMPPGKSETTILTQDGQPRSALAS